MFEDTYGPPFYNDLYNFKDGAQNDIFVGYYDEIPPPSPDSTVVPTPIPGPTELSSPPSASSNPNGIASSSPSASTSPTPSPGSINTGKQRMWYVLALSMKMLRPTHITDPIANCEDRIQI